MQMELNANEAQVLLNLIDIAVKAAGLQAAEAGLHFQKKLSALFPPPAAAPVENAVDAEVVN
jgi:hypothetical protein